MRANSAMNLFPMRIGSDEQSLFLSTGANKFTASIIAKGLVFGVLSRLVIVLLSLSVSRGFERVVGKRRGRFNQRRGVKRVSGRGPDGRHFPAGGERADESTRQQLTSATDVSNWA
jgi:hypothetical protein